MSNVDIKSKVFENPMLKNVLEQIEDKSERDKTIRVLEGFLEQLQGRADGLTKAYQEIAKK
jgi:hypothetical protein